MHCTLAATSMSNTATDGYSALDEAQVALLNAIVERLIPSDDQAPGAREAQAARYILNALATDYRRHLHEYIAGLADMDAHARNSYRAPFTSLEPTQQDAILAEFDRSMPAHDAPMPRSFFDLLLRHTREGVFGDPRWGGNADRVGWSLIGYGGPKYSWTAEEQQIEYIEGRRSP
jgi:gluconate 2-dehydrogenase gamma chain